MPETTYIIDIDASADAIFALLMPDRLADWYDSVLGMHVAPAGLSSITAGDRFTMHSERETMTVKVTTCERPKRFAWVSVEGRASSLSFEIKPQERGCTVEVCERYESRNLLGRLLDRPFVQTMIRDTLAANLDRLKALAEHDFMPTQASAETQPDEVSS